MPDRNFEYEAAFEELSGVDRGVSTVPFLWTGSAKRLAELAKIGIFRYGGMQQATTRLLPESRQFMM